MNILISQQRKDGENRIARAIEEKTNIVRDEITRESKIRNETIEEINRRLEVIINCTFEDQNWT